MAVTAGYNGTVSWAGGNTDATTNVYNWTLSYEAAEGETTAFVSSGPKTFIALTTEWSGSFTCRLDATAAMPAPGNSITEITLTAAAGRTYVGSAFITSVNPTIDVNGVPECVVNFRGTGALVLS